jgi:hypothetical protein
LTQTASFSETARRRAFRRRSDTRGIFASLIGSLKAEY